ncbi:MAG: DUF2852 domain-containing protein [Pseudomonadota bacterium]
MTRDPSPPLAFRILALVMFTGFAIPVSIVALVKFWPAGLLLAGFYAWQWTRLAGLDLPRPQQRAEPPLAPPATTGNASFDAYRTDTLARLEDERTEFEAFLTRLRAAKDQAEFDQFITGRAAT